MGNEYNNELDVEQANTTILQEDKINNSGQGKNTPVLSIISDRFNWGCIFCSWIWGLFNKTYIALLVIPISLIPFFGSLASLAFSIWLGFKGNTMAWQNKRWKSIEHFHKVQKLWAIVGCVITVIWCILIMAALTIPSMMTSNNKIENKMQTRKAIAQINQAFMLNHALEQTKCDLTSNGLANYFSKRVIPLTAQDNYVLAQDGIKYTFIGNGRCRDEGECFVKINVGKNWKKETIAPLYCDNDGLIQIKSEDVKKITMELDK